VSEISCNDPHHGSLTVHSYIESYTLAELAIDYINQHGASDPVYIDYFGSHQVQSILGAFTVCPGYPDSEHFSHSVPIQAVFTETSHTLSCSDPLSACPQINVNVYTIGQGDPHI
jgi:hypothetical protein